MDKFDRKLAKVKRKPPKVLREKPRKGVVDIRRPRVAAEPIIYRLKREGFNRNRTVGDRFFENLFGGRLVGRNLTSSRPFSRRGFRKKCFAFSHLRYEIVGTLQRIDRPAKGIRELTVKTITDDLVTYQRKSTQ